MVRDEIARHFGVAQERLHVIYNAVDSRRFGSHLQLQRTSVRAALGIPADAIVFLFLGSGFLRKGLRFALAALARLPQAARLLVVGHDKHLERYRRLASQLGVSERAHFAGAQRNPEAFYGASDVFVLPTLYDPCPNAALEAMASGLPVLTSESCGAAEIVTGHGAGLVAAADDVPALTQHMLALMDPAPRAQMGAAGGAAVRPLTPDAMSRQLLLLYHRLLGTGVAAGGGNGLGDGTTQSGPGSSRAATL